MRRAGAAALLLCVTLVLAMIAAGAAGASATAAEPPGSASRGAPSLAALGSPTAADDLVGPSPFVDGTGFDGGTVVGAGEEPYGCTETPGAPIREGPQAGRRVSADAPTASGPDDEVALTFDDGPSLTQTPAILETLVGLGAHATFFEEGRHVAGREALMRQILAAGDEIGNHSFHHPIDPGTAELASTDEAIREATGFTPCLFRPPYDEVDGKVERAARANDLATVLWTLDSEDDRHRDPAAIRRRVLCGARPGSIVLLHDGGHHPQTVRALPGIVEGLEARGLRLVTVTELLGGRMLLRP